MILDPQTTLFISRAFILAGALAMFFGAWQHRGIPGLKLWAAGYAAMVVATMIWLHSDLKNHMILGLGNCVAVLGFVFFWQGARAYQERNQDFFSRSILIVLLGLVGNFYYAVIEPLPHARFLLSACIGLVMTAAACYTMAMPGPNKQRLNFFLVLFFGLWSLHLAYKVSYLGYHLYAGLPVDATQNFVSTIMVFALLLSAFSGGAVLAAGQRVNEQLRQQADTDPQTGVYNRRAFDMAAGQALEQCARRGSNVALLMISLDKVDPIQQRFGQNAIDVLLKKFAQLLSASFRTQDVLARMSGKEFCVFMPETNKETAQRRGERIRQIVEQGGITSPDGNSLTASIGISCTNAAAKTHTTLATLIEHADYALYRAKRAGRNDVQCYEADKKNET